MNRKVFIFLLAGLLSFAAVNAHAQKPEKPNPLPEIYKTCPMGSRFEVLIFNDDDRRLTFKLDKFTGDIWEMTNGFRPLKFIKYTREQNADDIADAGEINYQLIAVNAYNIYLLNLKTGVMWEKTPDEVFKKVTNFQVVHEQ